MCGYYISLYQCGHQHLELTECYKVKTGEKDRCKQRGEPPSVVQPCGCLHAVGRGEMHRRGHQAPRRIKDRCRQGSSQEEEGAEEEREHEARGGRWQRPAYDSYRPSRRSGVEEQERGSRRPWDRPAGDSGGPRGPRGDVEGQERRGWEGPAGDDYGPSPRSGVGEVEGDDRGGWESPAGDSDGSSQRIDRDEHGGLSPSKRGEFGSQVTAALLYEGY